MTSSPAEGGYSDAPTHGPDGNPLYERQPALFQRLSSIRRSTVVRLNGSAPMQAVEAYDRGGDAAVVLTSFENTICEIASNAPLLVYAQAYLESAFYRQWVPEQGKFGVLRPVESVHKVPNPAQGMAPELPVEWKREAAVTFEEMYASRDARIQAADR